MIKKFSSLAFVLSVVVGVSWAGCSKVPVPRKDAVAEPIKVSADGVTAAEPAVLRAADGSIFVVYVEHTEKAADVFVQKMDKDGQSVGDKVRVNPNAGEAKAWKGDPPTIAIGGDNTIFVGWTRKYTDPAAKGNDLLLSVSHDGGRTFDSHTKVNDDTKPASHGMHSLAVDKTGRIYVAWLDERNLKPPEHHGGKSMDMSTAGMHHEEAEPNSEVFYSLSTDGGKSLPRTKRSRPRFVRAAKPRCLPPMTAQFTPLGVR